MNSWATRTLAPCAGPQDHGDFEMSEHTKKEDQKRKHREKQARYSREYSKKKKIQHQETADENTHLNKEVTELSVKLAHAQESLLTAKATNLDLRLQLDQEQSLGVSRFEASQDSLLATKAAKQASLGLQAQLDEECKSNKSNGARVLELSSQLLKLSKDRDADKAAAAHEAVLDLREERQVRYDCRHCIPKP